MNEWVYWIVFMVLAYISGSISFAYLLGKLRGVDIRVHGSGNVGASNVGRILGKKWGMICFVLDVLKGLVPVVVAGLVFGLMNKDLQSANSPDMSTIQAFLWVCVGIAAILGHMFSIFLKFKGGKGVATGFGAMVGLYPYLTWPALGAMMVWLICVKFTRIISVASMAAALSLPLWYFVTLIPRDMGSDSQISLLSEVQDNIAFMIVTVVLAITVVFKHRSNITRLINGTEPRIGEKA